MYIFSKFSFLILILSVTTSQALDIAKLLQNAGSQKDTANILFNLLLKNKSTTGDENSNPIEKIGQIIKHGGGNVVETLKNPLVSKFSVFK